MNATSIRHGGCLCGTVRFSARVEPEVQACHCIQCQRWTGGGPLLVVQAQELNLTGTEAIRTYRASEWGERAFCGTCGSTLYWRMQRRQISSLAVGLFDDQTGMRVTEEIFTDNRPDWLPHWPDAAQSTEVEELAKLAAHLAGDGNDQV